MLKYLLPSLTFLIIISSGFPAESETITTIHFFWGKGCPHCERGKTFLSGLKTRYPEIEIREYEVWHNRENAMLLVRLADVYGFKPSGVPVTFIGDRYIFGFSEQSAAEIESALQICMSGLCIDPLERIKAPTAKGRMPEKIKPKESVSLPILGEVNASKTSLPFFTLVIAGLDSFNPCSFFVLLSLMSLMIHAGSRRKMFIIGGTFVFFSGFIYFLFMAAWLNLFILAGRVRIVTTAAGFVAVLISAINIKDFFYFKKGISLSIPEKAKPGLFERMRGLLKAESLLSVLAGTVVLAIAANSYELLCTAGFPMIFTRVLTLHSLSPKVYYLYLLLYNIIYVIPLALIVAVFIITLGARKLTERQGRVLKLISGMMMLLLGLVLLINPALLNNVFTAFALLSSALALSFIIVKVTRD